MTRYFIYTCGIALTLAAATLLQADTNVAHFISPQPGDLWAALRNAVEINVARLVDGSQEEAAINGVMKVGVARLSVVEGIQGKKRDALLLPYDYAIKEMVKSHYYGIWPNLSSLPKDRLLLCFSFPQATDRYFHPATPVDGAAWEIDEVGDVHDKKIAEIQIICKVFNAWNEAKDDAKLVEQAGSESPLMRKFLRSAIYDDLGSTDPLAALDIFQKQFAAAGSLQYSDAELRDVFGIANSIFIRSKDKEILKKTFHVVLDISNSTDPKIAREGFIAVTGYRPEGELATQLFSPDELAHVKDQTAGYLKDRDSWVQAVARSYTEWLDPKLKNGPSD